MNNKFMDFVTYSVKQTEAKKKLTHTLFLNESDVHNKWDGLEEWLIAEYWLKRFLECIRPCTHFFSLGLQFFLSSHHIR
jgi:hypothetical protein